MSAFGRSPVGTAHSVIRAEAIMDREPDRAVALFDEVITLVEPVRNRFLAGVAGVSATSLRARHGDPRDALRSFREVIDLWYHGGDWTHLWTGLRSLVGLLARVDAADAAAVLHGAVLGPGSPAPPMAPTPNALPRWQRRSSNGSVPRHSPLRAPGARG